MDKTPWKVVLYLGKRTHALCGDGHASFFRTIRAGGHPSEVEMSTQLGQGWIHGLPRDVSMNVVFHSASSNALRWKDPRWRLPRHLSMTVDLRWTVWNIRPSDPSFRPGRSRDSLLSILPLPSNRSNPRTRIVSVRKLDEGRDFSDGFTKRRQVRTLETAVREKEHTSRTREDDMRAPWRVAAGMAMLASARAVCEPRGDANRVGTFRLEDLPSALESNGTVLGNLEIDGRIDEGEYGDLRGITYVSGNLDMSYIYGQDVLTYLEELESVGGDLKLVELASVQDLSGMANLENIGYNLILDKMNSLSTLVGLDALQEVGCGLTVSNTAGIRNLTGLEPILDLNGTLELRENAGLRSLKGLENMASVGDDVRLLRLYALPNLAGLNGLESVNGSFQLVENSALYSTEGLDSLEEIDGDLVLDRNYSLRSLAGFAKLRRIGGDLVITENSALNELSGLEALRSIGGDLIVERNWSLWNVDALLGLESIGGSIRFSENGEVQGAPPELTAMSRG